jgi:hypothetical protein
MEKIPGPDDAKASFRRCQAQTTQMLGNLFLECRVTM